MYFIRQLLQGQWVRTQQNLQNECMVKTDQTARIRILKRTSLIYVDGKDTSPTSWMHRLICVFTESILLYGVCCALVKPSFNI